MRVARIIAIAIVFLSGCASSSKEIPAKFPNLLKQLDPRALASVTSASRSQGDGFFVCHNGHLITVSHWKNYSPKGTFTLYNGSSHTAKVTLEYLPWDLIVLKAEGNFPTVHVPVLETLPQMGDTVYAITRDTVGNFDYMTGAIIHVNKDAYVSTPDGRLMFIPGAFAFWSDSAAKPGWSGSYVTYMTPSGEIGAGYLFASNYSKEDDTTYFHPISHEMLDLIVPDLRGVCD